MNGIMKCLLFDFVVIGVLNTREFPSLTSNPNAYDTFTAVYFQGNVGMAAALLKVREHH